MSKARDIILSVCKKCDYKWEDILKVIKEKIKVDVYEDIEKDLLEENPSMDYCTTIVDDNYCNVFKSANKPPFIYLYRGKEVKKRHYTFVNIINDTLKLTNFIQKYKNVKNIIYINKGCIYTNDFVIKILENDYKRLINYAILLCDNIIIVPGEDSEYDKEVLCNGIMYDKDIYVKSTLENSNNNKLIKDGAILFDESTEL